MTSLTSYLVSTPSKRGLAVGERVSYRVAVHTSDIPGAGTTARIFFFMSGQEGVTTPVSLPGVYDRATRVVNTFVGENVGPIQRIEIGHDSTGARPRWHMSYVEVTLLSGPHRGQTQVFVYDDWLGNKSRPGELAKIRLKALHPIRRNVYKVIVRTEDGENTGTSRRIYVRLKGYNGLQSDELELSASGRKNFQPGNSDVFLLDTESLSLGKIASIDIGFMPLRDDEERHEEDSWHLRSVTVVYLNTGESSEFDYNQTISASQDDSRRLSSRPSRIVRGGEKATPSKPPSGKSGASSPLPAKARLIASEVAVHGSLPSYVKKSVAKENHTYRVVVITSDIRNAGIDCRVFITLFGKLGNTSVVTLPGEFERNSRVETQFDDVDVGEIQSIRIGHDGTGISESWHVSYVTVEDLNSTAAKQIFFLNGAIRRRKAGESVETEIVPIGKARNIYRVIVRTSDVEGAGTNKLVTIRLAGRRSGGITEEFELSADRNKFDRGSVDVFYIDLGGVRLGTILGIDIGYKDQLTDDLMANYAVHNLVDWHLHSVTIEHMNTSKKAEFQYNDWLLNLQAKMEGKAAKLKNPLEGQQLNRLETIKQQGTAEIMHGMQGMRIGDEGHTPVRIQIFTSHIPGSGTQGKVALTIFGSLGTTDKVQIPGVFRDGSCVEYILNTEPLGGIKKISVEHGNADDDESGEWRLSRVVVQPLEGDEAARRENRRCFLHNGWLAGSGVVKITLTPLHVDSQLYRICVKTSDRDQPGVTGPVSIRLRGAKGKSSEMDLATTIKSFQKGSEDTFFINLGSLNVGKVESVDIGYRSTWEPSSDEIRNHIWHVSWVEVEHLSTGEAARVHYRKWISAGSRIRSGFTGPSEEAVESEEDMPLSEEEAAFKARSAALRAAASSMGIGTNTDTVVEEKRTVEMGEMGTTTARDMHLFSLPVVVNNNGNGDDPNEPDFQIYNNYLVTGSDGASEYDSEEFESLMEPMFGRSGHGHFNTTSDGAPMQPLLEELIAPPVEIGMITGKKLFMEPEEADRAYRDSYRISASGHSMTRDMAPPLVIPFGLTIPPALRYGATNASPPADGSAKK